MVLDQFLFPLLGIAGSPLILGPLVCFCKQNTYLRGSFSLMYSSRKDQESFVKLQKTTV